MANTSVYPTFISEPEIEEASSSDSVIILSSKANDSYQEKYETTSSSRLETFSQITWNPVSSTVLSTDVLTKRPDYENTFPSSSLQDTTQHSGTNEFNYQTPPSIFANLDHEENELDSDTRVTDMSKSQKTTSNTDLPPLYNHKFETVHSDSTTDNPHILYGNLNHSLSENEDEPISMKITKLDLLFEHNGKNSTIIPISPVSSHTTVGGSISASSTEFSNSELSAKSKEMSTISTSAETIMTDSSLFGSTKDIPKNLYSNNMRETENMENATFVTESMKLSDDADMKSTTFSNIELDAENREQESDLYDSSLDPNSTYTESLKDLESVKTSSVKTNEGLELTSSLNLQTTPVSTLFDQFEKSSEMSTLTTTIALKALDTVNVTTEKFPFAISDTSSIDISSNTRSPPLTLSTFHDESLTQNSSDLNSSQENYLSTITEETTAHSIYTIPIKSPDQEILNISKPTYYELSTLSDEFISTTSLETDVSSIFQLNNATVSTVNEGLKEVTEVSASIPEGTEIEKTIMPSIHSTEHLTSSEDEITETVSVSFERDRSSKYDVSTLSNNEKETSGFLTSVIPGLSDIAASTYSSANTFEDISKLLTTTEPSTMTGHYLQSTKKLFTTTLKDNEESNTVTDVPWHKHVDRESSTEYFTEQSTVPQTVPHHWFPSTRTQSPTTVSSGIEEAKSSTSFFISSHKDINTKTSINIFTEESIPPTYHALSSTTLEQLLGSTTDNVFSSFKPVHDFSSEETSTSKLESSSITDEIATSFPESYSTDTSTTLPGTHREGKHIPFSTASTVRVTDLSSEYSFLLVTTEKTAEMKAPVNDTEVRYMQIQIEDINTVDRNNMITAIIHFPVNSVHKTNLKAKLTRAHQWLDKVLTEEFWNWTRDPFEEVEEQENDIPFGNISIFYVKPTPETNTSHITLTFIIYNAWKNRTLPAHFVLGTLNFYRKELQESINASAVYFYHGVSTENYDLLSAVFDKYGIIIFTISLAVVGITILVCVVVFYRKKTRQSIHYLADSKLQQNLQEAVGIDLTPASIILQDEKEEKGSKICDDEGWLVPIADVPVAEDNNVPNVQDTKL
ncbi:unnamed protein product [Larinioides sclopetarius]